MKFFKKKNGPEIISKKIFNYFYGKDFFRLQNFKLLLRFCIFILFIFLLIWPQWDFVKTWKEQVSYNLIFAIDNSISSLANDWLEKNRLDRSKDFILKSINELWFWSFALLEFSWKSFISIPFTTDLKSFSSILSFISVDKFLSWTDFASSLKNIDSLFSYKKMDKKILVLFTDWENQNDFSDFDYLKNKWITIISVWVWSKEWSKIPLYYKDWITIYKQYKWEDVISKLNEDFLEKIASQTWWKYFFEDEFNWFISYLKKESWKTLSLKENIERREYFQIIAFMIFILLIIEMFFKKKYLKFIPFLSFLLFFWSCTSSNWEKWIEQYSKWNFEQSSELFEKLVNWWEKETALFNLWTSLYKEWSYKDAYFKFQKIWDRKIINSWKLDYQIWNTIYRIWENEKDIQKKIENWMESIAYYELWLEKNPKDKEMKENLEFVKSKLEELKKEEAEDGEKEESWKESKMEWEWWSWWNQKDVKLEKKDMEGLEKDLKELKGQEWALKWNFNRFWDWKFKLEWEPSTLNMKSLQDVLKWTSNSWHEDFQTGERDW